MAFLKMATGGAFGQKPNFENKIKLIWKNTKFYLSKTKNNIFI